MKRLFLFLWVLILAVPVWAGHYDLGTVKFPFEMPVKRLQKLGIRTTLDLWKTTKTPKDRKHLAAKLGLTLKQVERFHDFCDLLRVKGVGTKVAWVMQAAGIQNAAALAKADPEALNRKIKTVNKRIRVLGKLPGIELVRWWVHYAASLTK
jgi:nucleotidyltransferase/DNA polymerase involved in DNA repair